ncbi:hypothetical protein LEMLEM_LOCUS25025 [Lemmus lemmus]
MSAVLGRVSPPTARGAGRGADPGAEPAPPEATAHPRTRAFRSHSRPGGLHSHRPLPGLRSPGSLFVGRHRRRLFAGPSSAVQLFFAFWWELLLPGGSGRQFFQGSPQVTSLHVFIGLVEKPKDLVAFDILRSASPMESHRCCFPARPLQCL